MFGIGGGGGGGGGGVGVVNNVNNAAAQGLVTGQGVSMGISINDACNSNTNANIIQATNQKFGTNGKITAKPGGLGHEGKYTPK